MAKIKVFGGSMVNHDRNKDHHGQVRAIIACTSQREVARVTGETPGRIRDYWSVTSNETELSFALSSPGTLFQSSGLGKKDFEPIK